MPLEAITEFRPRVLLVDADPKFLVECSAGFRDHGYEVLTAQDGFEALQVLRGATPELLIADLNLPRMSGFELLSVVRTRFPQIGVIATSSDYTVRSLPTETIADAFVAKEPNALFELMETARGLVTNAPIRGSKPKSQSAPVWIPRSSTGYIILTCPECLRSFSTSEPKPGARSPLHETCPSCGADVHFRMSSTDVVRAPGNQSVTVKSRGMLKESRIAITTSQQAISASKTLLEKHKRK